MTPIFSRSWLMKISVVFDFDTTPVSLRSACDIRRACRPICASPISPSISAFGTSAATESTTTTSTPPDRIRTSTISSACSPLIRLRHEQVLEVHAKLLRVLRVERVLRIDERRHAARLLRLGNHLQRQRGLARRLRPVDFDDAAARHAADPKGIVDADGAGRNRRRPDAMAPRWPRRMIEPFAELLFNLADGDVERLVAFFLIVERHMRSPYERRFS